MEKFSLIHFSTYKKQGTLYISGYILLFDGSFFISTNYLNVDYVLNIFHQVSTKINRGIHLRGVRDTVQYFLSSLNISPWFLCDHCYNCIFFL